jgi:hypothetical protein
MEKAFINQQDYFMTEHILTHFSSKYQCIVETEESDVIRGAVLSQKEDDDIQLYIA